jgi:hypothetical protein
MNRQTNATTLISKKEK